MNHSFQVNVATEYGVNAAIIFENLGYWITKNEANGENFHDGTYWTYNSRKAFCALFPYLSDRQIQTALKKLVDGGLIITGNYNKSAYDRTCWYALTDKGKELFGTQSAQHAKMFNGLNKSEGIDTAKMFNGCGENVQSLNTVNYQDNNSDINADINTRKKHNAHAPAPAPTPVRELAEKEQTEPKTKTVVNDRQSADVLFERVWSVYPNRKGKGKVSVKAKRNLLDIGEDQLLRCITRYKSDLARNPWRQPQYGSTFFTLGYVDYLDANYSPPPPRPASSSVRRPRPTRFCNFKQRGDDETSIVRQLLAAQYKRYVALGIADDDETEVPSESQIPPTSRTAPPRRSS